MKESAAKKLRNQAGFIKDQMIALVTRLEDFEFYGDAEELEAIIDKYSGFLRDVNKQIDDNIE